MVTHDGNCSGVAICVFCSTNHIVNDSRRSVLYISCLHPAFYLIFTLVIFFRTYTNLCDLIYFSRYFLFVKCLKFVHFKQ